MPINGSFEDEYKQDKNYWGVRLSSIIKDQLDLFVHGSVLDVGAGDGRNALFLAKCGFDVTALDIAPTGLLNILEKSKNLVY